jgi:regulator of protease activity HflC (stomatin/prohibitin superfamily)
MIYLIAILVVLLLLGLASIRRVAPDEQLVVRRNGRVARTAGPGVAMVLPLVESAQRVDTAERHRWAVATEHTQDGATAHLRVEYLVRVSDVASAPVDLDAEIERTVEQRLSEEITASTSSSLPAVGADLGWSAKELLPGVRLEMARVTVSDVDAIGRNRA